MNHSTANHSTSRMGSCDHKRATSEVAPPELIRAATFMLPVRRMRSTPPASTGTPPPQPAAHLTQPAWPMSHHDRMRARYSGLDHATPVRRDNDADRAGLLNHRHVAAAHDIDCAAIFCNAWPGGHGTA